MQLTKHHGLGNDFLVAVGDADDPDLEPALAVAACDRHRGVGADGLLHLRPAVEGRADVTMVLLNADGSRAEMSGNGAACLAQAAVVWELADGPTIRIATDAGLRSVDLRPGEAPRTHVATVGMGVAEVLGDDLPEWAGGDVLRAAHVSIGNPHLVLQAASPDLVADREWVAALGRQANDAIPGGVNVEVVAPGGTGGELLMDVYERGVGLTLACGTGACAAATAARLWDLAGDDVVVRMQGGPARVYLGGKEIRLTTTVAYVADIEFHAGV